MDSDKRRLVEQGFVDRGWKIDRSQPGGCDFLVYQSGSAPKPVRCFDNSYTIHPWQDPTGYTVITESDEILVAHTIDIVVNVSHTPSWQGKTKSGIAGYNGKPNRLFSVL